MDKKITMRKQQINCDSEILNIGLEGLISTISENVKRAGCEDFVSIFNDKHDLYGIIDFSLFSITQLRQALNPNHYGDDNLFSDFDKACEDIGSIWYLALGNEKNTEYLISLEHLMVKALKNIIAAEDCWEESIILEQVKNETTH